MLQVLLIWGIGGMVDTLVLGTSATRRAGSSPVTSTIKEYTNKELFLGETPSLGVPKYQVPVEGKVKLIKFKGLNNAVS